ncbi:cobalamin-dependent protein [Thermococcus sp.]|uniref:cobalamin B12-binding domain-containing protein n=1 Tax=Thermococcus sp. TaxID=35749 RepID=UPI0026115F9B|nr:cobalamin-dependent protein [Thermococcus sp.]MCD6144192.1 cobalamin-dependent protein [Thermococcus sp.]
MNKERKKRILLVALDPVHDVGIRLIGKKLKERGYETLLLPRDTTPEEVIETAIKFNADIVMVSRTIGYNFEILSRVIELAEIAGIRKEVTFILGGRAIRAELAKELGYDVGFDPNVSIEDVIDFIEGKGPKEKIRHKKISTQKPDITKGFSYKIHDEEIKKLLKSIVEKTRSWAQGKTSPGIERAEIFLEMMMSSSKNKSKYIGKYLEFCDSKVVDFYHGEIKFNEVNMVPKKEIDGFLEWVNKVKESMSPEKLRHSTQKPLVFIQFGTGSPIADAFAIKVSESWGADGVIHFGPAWEARTEGLLNGLVAYRGDGTPTTFENVKLYVKSKEKNTLLTIRAHRGLNTPETVVIAGIAGAELTKINPVYGSICGGTDPERLVIDSIKALEYAAKFSLSYDIPTNEELAGVPPYKAFAGMLISAALGIDVGAKPILKPLFCNSPYLILEGFTEDNYVDYNFAKVLALRKIIDAPIWPGEPIGFMTHSEDRVQSSFETAFHALIGLSADVNAITIASSDEAYSGGPISVMARVDTLRVVKEAFRAIGRAKITPTKQANKFANDLIKGIKQTLKEVDYYDNLAEAIYNEALGTKEEGAYPGRAGRGTVNSIR